MITLARNELYRLFLSPLAWVILALTQLILAYLFLTHIDYFIQIQGRLSAIPGAPGVTESIIAPLLNNAAIVLMLVTPLITMRLIADEYKSNSFPLLLSAPLSITQIVIGKFIGSLGFFVILLMLISCMPLSLALGSDIDFGMLAAAMLGLGLLVASFNAIGLFLSSLTAQPAIAAITTFSCLFLLWIIDWAGSTQLVGQSSTLFSWLSLLRHFEPLLQGDVNSSDISYFVILIVACLIITIRRLDTQRLN